MGWLSALVGIAAAVLLYGTGHEILFALAIASVAGCFWSWGIMHNYATNTAKKRSSYRGNFYDFTGQEIQSAPNWITVVNMILTLTAVGLLITGLVVRFM
jgi:hypothetical protein